MSNLIAVTGATGFIGRTVCRILHEQGWRVRVLVRSKARLRALDGLSDEQVYGHIADPEALQALVKDSLAVVHLAGAVRGATQDDFDCVNVEGVRHLVEAVARCPKPPRLLCLSSLAAREPQLSFYAASKRRGEQVLEQQAGQLCWMALRPPAVYGPGDKELLPVFRLMARGIALVPGCREARFSMIHVDDLAAAILAWLQQADVPSGIYTLHDGREGGYCWTDVATIVSHLCGRRVREIVIPAALLQLPAWLNRGLARLFGYAPMLTPEKLCELSHADWVCDNEDIQKVLDWQPRIQLQDGLRGTPGWCVFK
ncbi:MAG: NAD-dependent epimerase/dehydratase family protein [Thiogranum sp.]|nr:NAD-dependent epimerase/dehydratase family protein [Thiogranum sp.]